MAVPPRLVLPAKRARTGGPLRALARNPAALAILGLGACAAARTSPSGGGGGSGGEGATATTSSTTPTNGGTGGTGATGSTGATGGTTGSAGSGGTTTTSTGGAGGGGNGGGTASGGGGTTSSSGGSGGGGGAPTGRVVTVAGSAASMLGGVFEEGAGWSVTTIVSTTGAAPAVALDGPGSGIALFRSAADSHLLFSQWNGATFTAPLAIGMLAVAQGAPSMAYEAGAFPVGYWGSDNKHYFARYVGQGGGWSPVAEAVQPMGGGQSFGSSAPALASVGGEPYLVHTGTDGKIYEQRRSGNTWTVAAPHDVGNAQPTISPTAIALSGGAEDMLVVYVVAANSQIGWMTRKPGAPPVWNAGALITDALTQDRIAVAALPGGGAVMAFRGLNTNIYTSLYTPGANPPWSAPAPLAAPNYSTPSSPALAPGIGAATAELVFADGATGKAWHARLLGQTWQSPTQIGGTGVQFVGLSSSP